MALSAVARQPAPTFGTTSGSKATPVSFTGNRGPAVIGNSSKPGRRKKKGRQQRVSISCASPFSNDERQQGGVSRSRSRARARRLIRMSKSRENCEEQQRFSCRNPFPSLSLLLSLPCHEQSQDEDNDVVMGGVSSVRKANAQPAKGKKGGRGAKGKKGKNTKQRGKGKVGSTPTHVVCACV